MREVVYQNLNLFSLPVGFRGRSKYIVQIWWLVESSLFRWSPQMAYGFRVWLLRLFGAHVGSNCLIRPSVRVVYPWKVWLGDSVWIGDDVVLYSLGNITVGSNTVVSQRSYLCAADHDYSVPDFPIRSRDVTIEDEVWIATDVFVAPGVIIKHGSVIGARSSVFSDIPDAMICYGNPCRPVRPRRLH